LLVSSAVLDEQLIDRPAPQYPDVARRTGLQGSVVLNVTIGANGRVSAVKVLRGPALLADAAVSAVSRWHYRPYTVDGKPVPVQTEVVIRFALPR
jgi:protein TonB